MYSREPENDTCPHNTFSGCGCYGRTVDYNDLNERNLGDYDTDDPANWPGNNPYGDERKPFKPSDDPNLWRNASGSYIPLVSMSDLHLARAIGSSVQHDSVTHPRTKALLAELTRRSMPPEQAPAQIACALAGNERVS
jgi:hypothetical protein